MKTIVSALCVAMVLAFTSCASQPSQREFRKPPVAVLDEIPAHFDKLKRGMTESEILDTIGLSAYRLYMSFGESLDGGIGGFNRSWFGSGRHSGYSLRIHQALSGDLAVSFSSPRLKAPLEKHLGKPIEPEN